MTLLCACCCNPVLSQHTLYGSQTYESDAIGLSQGGASEAGPTLRRQVQNLAAHDTVGYFLFGKSGRVEKPALMYSRITDPGRFV
jgi:hypothetical protein